MTGSHFAERGLKKSRFMVIDYAIWLLIASELNKRLDYWITKLITGIKLLLQSLIILIWIGYMVILAFILSLIFFYTDFTVFSNAFLSISTSNFFKLDIYVFLAYITGIYYYYAYIICFYYFYYFFGVENYYKIWTLSCIILLIISISFNEAYITILSSCPSISVYKYTISYFMPYCCPYTKYSFRGNKTYLLFFRLFMLQKYNEKLRI